MRAPAMCLSTVTRALSVRAIWRLRTFQSVGRCETWRWVWNCGRSSGWHHGICWHLRALTTDDVGRLERSPRLPSQHPPDGCCHEGGARYHPHGNDIEAAKAPVAMIVDGEHGVTCFPGVLTRTRRRSLGVEAKCPKCDLGHTKRVHESVVGRVMHRTSELT
jgi:hypothetical protein